MGKWVEKPRPGYPPDGHFKFPHLWPLTPEDYKNIHYLQRHELPGTDEEVIRAAVMLWYTRHRRNKSWDLFGPQANDLPEIAESTSK